MKQNEQDQVKQRLNKDQNSQQQQQQPQKQLKQSQIKQQQQNQKRQYNVFSCICKLFYNLIILLLKLLVYYGDIICGILLTIEFYDENKYYFGVLTSFIIMCHIYKVVEVFQNEHRLYVLKAFFELIGLGQLFRCIAPSLFTVQSQVIQIYQGIIQSAPSFMIVILSIFYSTNHPIKWNINGSYYHQIQTISFLFSLVSLFYANYTYFYVRYEDFKKADIKMKSLFALFKYGEYSSRVCSWGLAAYFGGEVFVWTIIGIDFIFAVIASIMKLSDNKLLPFFDYLFCFRMYDCYLFYGNKFDSTRYVNLKELQRFLVQLAVIIYVIRELAIEKDQPTFFYAMMYVCGVGIVINFVYNANRLLYKKDDESEIILTYKRMIVSMEQEMNELNLKIKHIVPLSIANKEDEENKINNKNEDDKTQINSQIALQIEQLQTQINQLQESVLDEQKQKREIELMYRKIDENRESMEQQIKELKDKQVTLEKLLKSEQILSESLRGDKAIIQDHLAKERKQCDELKRMNYYLQHDQGIPEFYSQDLQKKLDDLKKESEQSEQRFKQLEEMYQKRERELKQRIYQQTNHDIQLNSYSTVTNVLQKQNDVLQKKQQMKENENKDISQINQQLLDEIKQLKQINQELNIKLDHEDKLNLRQQQDLQLLQNFNENEYSINQHHNLNLKYLFNEALMINKFDDWKLIQKDTEKIVFNNFINMNIIDKITAVLTYPQYFAFNFVKKSSLFNTGQNCQNELFIFSNLLTKHYSKMIKAISIQASNWINVTSETFQNINKILTQCISIKVFELNLENCEANNQETYNSGFSLIFNGLTSCQHIQVLHLNLSGQDNFSDQVWNSLFEGISSQKKLGEFSLDISKRGCSTNGMTSSQFDSLCQSISKLRYLQNLSFNFAEWRDNELNDTNIKTFGQIISGLPKLRLFRVNLKHFSNYHIDSNFLENLVGDLIRKKDSQLESISLSLDGMNEYRSELNDAIFQNLLQIFKQRKEKYLNQILISAEYIKNCSPQIISLLRRELNVLCQYLNISYQMY